jgi:nitronate monooxygenase
MGVLVDTCSAEALIIIPKTASAATHEWTKENGMHLPDSLARRLSLTHPVVQAPMAGGADTPALVAAVSGAGGIGFIGAAYLAPEAIHTAARAVRERTDRPFGINLFAPMPPPTGVANIERAIARVSPYYAELGLPPPATPAAQAPPFDEQLAASIESGAAALSFTFGLLPNDAVARVKARGMMLIGTATSVEEAVALEAAGVDAVVAQGSEAGGHRATFIGAFESAMVGTIVLVPQVVDAVGVPVIASGGIMDGRGVAAALALGASAVQMGTAFLTCDEAGIPAVYKECILRANERQTRVTRAFSGRLARGIVNRLMDEIDGHGEDVGANAAANHPVHGAGDSAVHGAGDDAILPFPLQNALTRPLRTAAAKQGRAEFLSLWAGQGARMARRQSAADLVSLLAQETNAAARRLASRGAVLASLAADEID